MVDDRFHFTILTEEDNPYDFQTQLDKLRRKRAIEFSDSLKCPFCGDEFKVKQNHFKEQDGAIILQTCPGCESILKILRTRSTS